MEKTTPLRDFVQPVVSRSKPPFDPEAQTSPDIRLLYITDRPSQTSRSKTKFQLNQNVENVNITNIMNMELTETVERTRTTARDDFVKIYFFFIDFHPLYSTSSTPIAALLLA
uniref:Uncharacterized protein n=1 Tax=Glossina austeni TaxID=7395 RepID=A0A1A9UVB8_GLOAU